MKKSIFILMIIIILCFSFYGYYELIKQNGGLTGLTIGDSKDIKIIYEQNSAPSVYFTTEENITPIFVSMLNDAEDIKCALYEASEPTVVSALKQNNALVAVENDNYHGEFHTGNSSGEMHNKFCSLDNETVFTGSTNLNKEGIYNNDNNFLIIHSKYIAKNYLDEFNEIYNDRFATGEKIKFPMIILNNETIIQNYFCPEDECQKHVLETLETANFSIIFMTFSFTDKKIADKLIEKKNKSVDVIGIFEKQRYNIKSEVYKYLNESGVNIIPDKNKYIMHHKVFIIDNETVITGSYNPTGSGNKYNDENIIIIKDKTIAKRYIDEFLRLINK
jgi:phosphatidylserine/phosphatidylglycerophosphate/cardiolipin synthase-like enzyme